MSSPSRQRRRRAVSTARRGVAFVCVLLSRTFSATAAAMLEESSSSSASSSSSSSSSSSLMEAHAQTLEALVVAPRGTLNAETRTRTLKTLMEETSRAPTLDALRERAKEDAVRRARTREEEGNATETTDEEERKSETEEWRIARESLYVLSALKHVGLIRKEWLAGHAAYEKLTEGDEDGWERSALERAALMGDAWARTALGHRLLKGYGGFAKDEEQALTLLRDVATEGLERGPTTYELESPSGAEWLRDRERDAGWVSESVASKAMDQLAMELDAAARGDDGAHALLGYRALVGGRGLDQDEGAAFRHFEEAAQRAGLPAAHYNLGFMYMNGMGTEQNYTAAREHFLHAVATGGIAPAYNGLGVLAFNGLVGEQNYTEAMYFFEKASELDDPDGYFNLAQMYHSGHGVEANATYALEIMERASELGHWRAPYELGMTYSQDVVIPKNVSKAANLFHIFIEERFEWDKERNNAIEEVLLNRNAWGALVRYALVASLGSESAANNVVWLLRKSNAYTEDDRYELAARMLREIIVCYNSPEARVDLGDILSARKARPDLMFDLEKNYEQVGPNASTYDVSAANHYAAAAFNDKPYAEALVNLGWAHFLGAGVTVNASRSFELFEAATNASINAYEATPCVIAAVIAKLWLLAASLSLRLNLGSLHLPSDHFAEKQLANIPSTRAAMSVVEVIRAIEVLERYLLFGLTAALAIVIVYRAMLPSQ
jgi:SEL1 protein